MGRLFSKLFSKNRDRLRIAFLLGSGISIPAGILSTHQLTECILSGIDIIRNGKARHHSDDTFSFHYTDTGAKENDEYVSRIVPLLNKLKAEIDLYYFQNGRTGNYEDLYYVVNQIEESLSGDHENPAIQPFIERIANELQPLLAGKPREIRERWTIHELMSETKDYIHDVVSEMLRMPLARTDHLDFIKNACHYLVSEGLDIFTLNHDTLLEQVLLQFKNNVVDGFGVPLKDVRYWDPSLFENQQSKIRFLKLHGSINWYRFRPEGGNWGTERVGIPLNRDIWHQEAPLDGMQLPVEGRSMMLVGTFNKMLRYTGDIYADLHYHFRRRLRKVTNLVICGYGFGDKGINSQLIEWSYSHPGLRIVIIHHDFEGLKRRARYAIRANFEEWAKRGILSVIHKRIEQISWQEIENLLKK